MDSSKNEGKPEFFTFLPPDIVIDLLSRLPIRTIVICKCVCRSWRDILRTREFADFHLTNSVPGLVIASGMFHTGPNQLKFFEFDDELGLEHHDLHYKPLNKIDKFIRSSVLRGSTNGLLLLCTPHEKRDLLCVCNPISRECIDLPNDRLVYSSKTTFAYGFGVCRMTGQYKVVKIFHECNSCEHDAHTLLDVTMSFCLVYALGTGIWRSIALPAPFLWDDSVGVYLNGNLHWLVQVLDGYHCISCFDLETETFTMFSLPSQLNERFVMGLAVLGDCLCVSDTTEDDVVIWLMKEYGDDKSWTKEFSVIRRIPDIFYDDFLEFDAVVHPIKVFKDGDILMDVKNMCMIYYSNKSKTIEQAELFSEDPFYVCGMKAMLYTSSFISLSSFVNERVSRF